VVLLTDREMFSLSYLPRVKKESFLLSITNKMQRYTIFLVIINALHVSGGFSAHHQDLKNCIHNIGYVSGLLLAIASGSSRQAWHIADAVCVQFLTC